MSRRAVRVCMAVVLMGVPLALGACGSKAASSASPTASYSAGPAANGAKSGTPPSGKPPTGTAPSGAPSGAPPGGQSGGQSGGAGGTTAAYTATGTYTLSGGSATKSGVAISATVADRSAVLVKKSGSLKLVKTTIKKSGDSKSLDGSSFYGLNAGILAESAAKIVISGGSVTTTGAGANGVFAYGSGASIVMADATIKATAQGGHGAMASGGGSISLKNVNINTAGAAGAALATDRGGGTVTAAGGTIRTSGMNSPGIYSTGVIKVSGAKITASGAEAVVIEGSNSVVLKNTSASGAKNRGVMIYQSMSGDAAGAKGTFTMTGGALSAAAGPLFYVTNSTGIITLANVTLTAHSGTLIDAAPGAWGTSGSNGGVVKFTATDEKLTGDVLTGTSSSISLNLKHASTLKGKIDKAALTLDATSRWTVTANSALSALSDTSGISGDVISNIIGNGHTVTYDASLAANRLLGGKTYSLANGGRLMPS